MEIGMKDVKARVAWTFKQSNAQFQLNKNYLAILSWTLSYQISYTCCIDKLTSLSLKVKLIKGKHTFKKGTTTRLHTIRGH